MHILNREETYLNRTLSSPNDRRGTGGFSTANGVMSRSFASNMPDSFPSDVSGKSGILAGLLTGFTGLRSGVVVFDFSVWRILVSVSDKSAPRRISRYNLHSSQQPPKQSFLHAFS